MQESKADLLTRTHHYSYKLFESYCPNHCLINFWWLTTDLILKLCLKSQQVSRSYKRQTEWINHESKGWIKWDRGGVTVSTVLSRNYFLSKDGFMFLAIYFSLQKKKSIILKYTHMHMWVTALQVQKAFTSTEECKTCPWHSCQNIFIVL